jgi:hypothetical protein
VLCSFGCFWSRRRLACPGWTKSPGLPFSPLQSIVSIRECAWQLPLRAAKLPVNALRGASGHPAHEASALFGLGRLYLRCARLGPSLGLLFEAGPGRCADASCCDVCLQSPVLKFTRFPTLSAQASESQLPCGPPCVLTVLFCTALVSLPTYVRLSNYYKRVQDGELAQSFVCASLTDLVLVCALRSADGAAADPVEARPK